MNVDLRKCLDAALLPVAIIIVIGFALQLIAIFMPAYAMVADVPVLVVDLVVLAWAGYRVVKEQSMDFVSGVVTGATAGLIASLVGVIIGLALMALGIGANLNALNAASGYSATVLVLAVMIGLLVSVLFGAVEGAVCGAVGAYVAGMKK